MLVAREILEILGVLYAIRRISAFKTQIKGASTRQRCAAAECRRNPERNRDRCTPDPDLSDDALRLIFERLPLFDLYVLRLVCRRISEPAASAFLARSIKLIRGTGLRVFSQTVREIRRDKTNLPTAKTQRTAAEIEEWGHGLMLLDLELIREQMAERLAPFSLGRILRHAGISADSSLVHAVAYSCLADPRFDAEDCCTLLRGLGASAHQVLCQLNARRFFPGDSNAPFLNEALAAAGLSSTESLHVVTGLVEINEQVRWETIAALSQWNEDLAAGRLNCFREVYDILDVEGTGRWLQHMPESIDTMVHLKKPEFAAATLRAGPFGKKMIGTIVGKWLQAGWYGASPPSKAQTQQLLDAILDLGAKCSGLVEPIGVEDKKLILSGILEHWLPVWGLEKLFAEVLAMLDPIFGDP